MRINFKRLLFQIFLAGDSVLEFSNKKLAAERIQITSGIIIKSRVNSPSTKMQPLCFDNVRTILN